MSAGGRERPILVARGLVHLEGRVSETLLHGSPVVLRLTLAYEEVFLQEYTSDTRAPETYLIDADGGDDREQSVNPARPSRDVEIAVEISMAGSFLHRQLQAVHGHAYTQMPQLLMGAAPAEVEEDRPEGLSPPGSPEQRPGSPGDHGAAAPSKLSGDQTGPAAADKVRVVSRLTPSLLAKAETKLAKLGFTPNSLAQPAPVSTVTVFVLGMKELPNLVASQVTGLREAPTTFVSAISMQGVARGDKAILTDKIPYANNPVFNQVLGLQIPDAAARSERILLGVYSDHDPTKTLSRVEIPLAHMVPGVHYPLRIQLSDFTMPKGSEASVRRPTLEVVVMISPSPARYINDWLVHKDTDRHSFRCALTRLPKDVIRKRCRRAGIIFLRWRFEMDDLPAPILEFIPGAHPDGATMRGALELGTRASVLDQQQVFNDSVPAFSWSGTELSPIWSRDPEVVLSCHSMGLAFSEVTALACDVLYFDPNVGEMSNLFSLHEPVNHLLGKGVQLGELKVFDKQLLRDHTGHRDSVQIRVLVTDGDTELLRLGTKFDFPGNPIAAAHAAREEERKVFRVGAGPPSSSGGGGGGANGPPPRAGTRGPPPGRFGPGGRGPPPPRNANPAAPGSLPAISAPPSRTGSQDSLRHPPSRDASPAPRRSVGTPGPGPGMGMGPRGGGPPPSVDDGGAAEGTREMANKLLQTLFFSQAILNTLATRAERLEASAQTNFWRLQEREVMMQEKENELLMLGRQLDAERKLKQDNVVDYPGSLVQMSHEELLAKAYALSQNLHYEQQRTKDLEARHEREHRNVVAANVAIQRYQKLQTVFNETRRVFQEREAEYQRLDAYKRTIGTQEEVIAKLENVVEALSLENRGIKETVAQKRRELALLMEQAATKMTSNESEIYVRMQERMRELYAQLDDAMKARSVLQEELSAERAKTLEVEAKANALEEQIKTVTAKNQSQVMDLKNEVVELEAQLQATEDQLRISRDNELKLRRGMAASAGYNPTVGPRGPPPPPREGRAGAPPQSQEFSQPPPRGAYSEAPPGRAGGPYPGRGGGPGGRPGSGVPPGGGGGSEGQYYGEPNGGHANPNPYPAPRRRGPGPAPPGSQTGPSPSGNYPPPRGSNGSLPPHMMQRRRGPPPGPYYGSEYQGSQTPAVETGG